MNLSRKNVISHGTEGVAPKRKKVSIAKRLYFIFISLIGLYFLRILILDQLYIEGTGSVVTPVYSVKVQSDSVISELNLNKGDMVKKDQLLFKSIYEDQSLETKTKDNFTAEKNILNLQMDIETIKSEITILDKNIKNNNIFYSLDIYNSVDYNSDKEKLRILKEKLSIMKEKLKSLKKMRNKLEDYYTQRTVKKVYNYVSPVSGKIIDKTYKNSDFVLKGSEVLVISEEEHGYVEGYFEPSKVKYLEIGKEVTVFFPNEEKVTGTIVGMESSKIGQKEALSYFYIPKSTSMKVQIALNDENKHFLKEFNAMSVKIEVSTTW